MIWVDFEDDSRGYGFEHEEDERRIERSGKVLLWRPEILMDCSAGNYSLYDQPGAEFTKMGRIRRHKECLMAT